MSPQKFVQTVLTVIGVCAPEQDVELWKRYFFTAFFSALFGMRFFNTCASSIYLIKYMSDDYFGSLYALLEVAALICRLWTLITSFYYKHVIREIFAVFEFIQKKSKINLERSFFFFFQIFIFFLFNCFHFADQNTKPFQKDSFTYRASDIVSIFFIKYYISGYFATCISIYGVYNTKSLPSDQKIILGWAITIEHETVFGGDYFSVIAMFVGIFVTICLQFHSLREHFKEINSKINDDILNGRNPELNIQEILCEGLRFHEMVQEYVTMKSFHTPDEINLILFDLLQSIFGIEPGF